MRFCSMKVAVKFSVHKLCSSVTHNSSSYSPLINIFIIKQILLNVSAGWDEGKDREKGWNLAVRGEENIQEVLLVVDSGDT